MTIPKVDEILNLQRQFSIDSREKKDQLHHFIAVQTFSYQNLFQKVLRHV